MSIREIMTCFAYILYSQKRQRFYVGVANDIADRLKRHNNAESLSTKTGVPWELLHSFSCVDKSAAMILERKIKNRGIRRYLIDQGLDPLNG